MSNTTMTDLKAEKIRGVFSSQEVRKIGTGTTARKSITKVFWYMEEDEKGELTAQSINVNGVPTGNKKPLTREELLERYTPEPEYYTKSVYPQMRKVEESIENGNKCRERGESFSAENEYNEALLIDVDNVKANFGIGLTYLERGENDKADDIFQRLVHLEGSYMPEHKHLYNEFGINLRKNGLLDQAITYYTKALELSTTDENLYINIARVYFDQEDIEECLNSIISALQVSPKNQVASTFAQWLLAKKFITNEDFASIPKALLRT